MQVVGQQLLQCFGAKRALAREGKLIASGFRLARGSVSTRTPSSDDELSEAKPREKLLERCPFVGWRSGIGLQFEYPVPLQLKWASCGFCLEGFKALSLRIRKGSPVLNFNDWARLRSPDRNIVAQSVEPRSEEIFSAGFGGVYRGDGISPFMGTPLLRCRVFLRSWVVFSAKLGCLFCEARLSFLRSYYGTKIGNANDETFSDSIICRNDIFGHGIFCHDDFCCGSGGHREASCSSRRRCASF